MDKDLLTMDLDEIVKTLDTSLDEGLSLEEAHKRLAKFGPNRVPEQKAHPVIQFLKKFWGLSAWMLELVVILSLFLNKRFDAYIVVALLVINAVISYTEERKASGAIEELREKLRVESRVMRSGKWTLIPAAELVPGDVVRLRLGDFVPADIKLSSGEIWVDQSGLTGESMEIEKGKSQLVYSGSIVRRGESTGVVLLTGAKTYFGKTTELVQVARPKLHIEALITNVTKALFLVVVILTALGLGATIWRQMPVLDVLPLMLVVLLSAVPVALPIMLTVSTSIGAMDLAKENVLVTKLSAPEDASTMDVLCVDKTGTITKNQLSIKGLRPDPQWTEDQLVEMAALASNEADRDPIDMAFISLARERNLLNQDIQVIEFKPFDPSTRRTEARVRLQGKTVKVTKGATKVILDLCHLTSDDMKRWMEQDTKMSSDGHRTLGVALARENDNYQLVGLTSLYDPPREDSAELISELKNLGVRVKMLTGDSLSVAIEIARMVGLGNTIVSAVELRRVLKEEPEKAAGLIENADGFAEVYPEDKYNIVKVLQSRGHIVGMTGDGVNDAPALKQAEVGIAVASATDVAKGAASTVLTSPGLIGILSLVKIGRMVYERINTWIVNKISRTILKSSYVVLTFLLFGKYTVSAFAMLLLLFMTDFVKVSLSTDNVKWSPKPNNYDISPMVKLGTSLGVIMSLEAMGFLYFAMSYFKLSQNSQVLGTFSFVLLLFFALFSIFVVRQRKHFWSIMPSKFLLFAIIGDFLLGSILASIGLPGFPALNPSVIGGTFLYSLIFALVINDRIKVAVFKAI